jgi:Ca2+-binding RTX toxin-like protein
VFRWSIAPSFARAALLAAVILVVAAPARAAQVSVSQATEEEGTLTSLNYSAAAGEVNRLTLSQGTPVGGDPTIVVRDSGAPIAAGDGCTATVPGEAVCRMPVGDFDNSISASLDDGDDTADARAVRSAKVLLEGGRGADTLRGSRGQVNSLFGDTIAGRRAGGVDVLVGGQASDFLLGGPRDDTLDGRRGRDEASYSNETSRVFVSLPAGRAEAPAHTDALTSIENVEGGDGGDTLIGNAGRNRLTGEGGKDELRGNAGDDRLVGDGGGLFVGGGGKDDTMVGGPGNDLLLGERGDDRMFGRSGHDRLIAGRGRDDVFGGTGNDRVNSRDGRRDTVRCQAGADLVRPDALDVLFGCDQVL